ncbi:hypothetical protein N431DRAFT_498411 [Stipitochalara longipes BDJ]|nr:hypothetical protein N431DRAFT_498411 [Stipitochalara longipes BDJ]
MAPHCPLMNHYMCCGIKVMYFEQCGHTTIEADHHPACEHRKTELSPLAQPRQLTPSNPRPALRQPFPQAHPKCKDLHNFIELMDGKCLFCTNPPQIGSWHKATSSFVSTWAPLSKQEIFERGVYWLNEMLLAREEEYQGDLADWEAGLLDRREVGSEDKVKKCGACKDEMGNVMVKKLPCGCVLHLKCLQRWFAVKKCCPGCAVGFKLVKIPKRPDASAKWGDYYPIWKDDGYFNFI